VCVCVFSHLATNKEPHDDRGYTRIDQERGEQHQSPEYSDEYRDE
jgi:hypothetical protein